jgi:hypothetical protein
MKEVTLQCGDAEVTVAEDGTITICSVNLDAYEVSSTVIGPKPGGVTTPMGTFDDRLTIKPVGR